MCLIFTESFDGWTIHLDGNVPIALPSTGGITLWDNKVTPVRNASSVNFTSNGENKQIVICELLVYGGK